MKRIRNQSLWIACAAMLSLSLSACTNADFATDNGSDLTVSSSVESAVQETDSASPTASPAKINPLEDDFRSASSAESDTSSENTGITNSDVRLRSEPGGSATGTVPNNTQVTIISKSGDWYQIRYEGQEGYIYGQYLTLSDGSNGLESDDDGE